MRRKLFIYTITALGYGLGGLFIYAAAKKVKDYTAYAAHIEASELFNSAVSGWVSKGVIGVEVLLAFLLMMPYLRVQMIAWRAIPLWMGVYSYYIYYILYKAPFTPCACKGVNETWGWMGHLYLNIGIAVLAIGLCIVYYLGTWINKKINLFIGYIQQRKRVYLQNLLK